MSLIPTPNNTLSLDEASLQHPEKLNLDHNHSVAFHTLGCKTNQLETSTLANEFKTHGWQIVPFEAAASLYIINTCTVTEKGDQESLRMIRRAKLSNPEGRIAVTGCYAQVAPDELAKEKGIHYIIGNNFKDKIFSITQEIPATDTPYVNVSEIDKSRIMEGASAAAVGRTRGSLKIQDGCDYKCTYCIIWEARGLSRSLPVEDIKAHLTHMVAEGFHEIVLTGINIGQYQDGKKDLADLLSELIELPGNFRLRLSSLDPLEVPLKLIEVVANAQGKIAPHFHLSAQSAEDTVLKRMARRHHVAEFQEVCQTIHQLMPHACIGSDIIVGFPGETDERFESTFQVLSTVPIHYFHTFSYSKRKGTPAADFPDQVPLRIKKERAKRLTQLSEEKNLCFRQQFLGKHLHVIVEEGGLKGMSENYLKISLNTAFPVNTLVQVQITQVTPEETHGKVVQILSSDIPSSPPLPLGPES
jgi:threonylcarbamoyladenosine tRNA methylthiotransferase MtaB